MNYEELKESIRKHGILVPVLVVDRHTVIDGNKRVKAAKELGIMRIPAVFLDNPVVETTTHSLVSCWDNEGNLE